MIFFFNPKFREIHYEFEKKGAGAWRCVKKNFFCLKIIWILSLIFAKRERFCEKSQKKTLQLLSPKLLNSFLCWDWLDNPREFPLAQIWRPLIF